MSGSNSICVATVLLETGIARMLEPETRLVLEAPGGLVEVTASCRDGRVEKVSVANVPSFAGALGVHLEVGGIGTLQVDTGFGGDSFVMVDAAQLGMQISPDEARELAEIGVRITDAANEQIGFAHPIIEDWKHISFCQIHSQQQSAPGSIRVRNAVALKPGKLDRSPTGTGVCARMAVLHAKGMMAIADSYVGESIIGSRFEGRILGTTRVGQVPAILPEFSGRAWITGVHQHTLDPTDPWPEGYRVADTWPAPRRPPG